MQKQRLFLGYKFTKREMGFKVLETMHIVELSRGVFKLAGRETYLRILD